MGTKELNNKIILCRPAIRKAKIAVLRQLLIKMNTLKSSKNETEETFDETADLFEEIQKLKEDDVIKFALGHVNLNSFLMASATTKQKALASLAKHDAVAIKVKNIQEEVPDWKAMLSVMSDTLEEKNSAIKTYKKESVMKTKMEKTIKEKNELKRVRSTGKVVKDTIKIKKKPKKPEKNGSLVKGVLRGDGGDVDRMEESVKKENNDEKETESHVKLEKIEDSFFIEKKVIAPKLAPEVPSRRRFDADEFGCSTKPLRAKRDFVNPNRRSNEFGWSFPEKRNAKAFGDKGRSPREFRRSFQEQRNANTFGGQGRPLREFRQYFQDKRGTKPFGIPTQSPKEFRQPHTNRKDSRTFEQSPEVEKLHPSWAAKKIQMIKPFEGKKVKFDDD